MAVLCVGRKYVDDPLNIAHKRSFENSNRRHYNCAGYALGTYSWYIPCPSGANWDDWFGFYDEEEAENKTWACVRQMLEDIPYLRVLRSVQDVDPTEDLIAFRLASDGDFHFLKKSPGSCWHHKMGNLTTIDTMEEDEVFSEEWCGRYDGPIIFLGKLREGA